MIVYDDVNEVIGNNVPDRNESAYVNAPGDEV